MTEPTTLPMPELIDHAAIDRAHELAARDALLEHARMGGHALNSESGAERPVWSGQVRHKILPDDLAEGSLLLPRKVLPVPLEAG